MNPLETLQALNLAVDTLSKIDHLSIDNSTKNEIKQKVLDTVHELLKPPNKKTEIQQGIIIGALHKLGGKGLRREIIEETRLAPNMVSSLLNKLYKAKKIDKIKIDKPIHRSGRGLQPEFIYALLNEE